MARTYSDLKAILTQESLFLKNIILGSIFMDFCNFILFFFFCFFFDNQE